MESEETKNKEDDTIVLEFADQKFTIDPSVPLESDDSKILLEFHNMLSKSIVACVKGKMIIDSEYRQWRGITAENLLSENPKMAEWKINANINSTASFTRYKAKQAEWTSILLRLQHILDLTVYKLNSRIPSRDVTNGNYSITDK